MTAQVQPNNTEVSRPLNSLEVRNATVSDAAKIWKIVHDCEVLDENSCYAYLLVCRDFAATSLVAVSQTNVLGFVTAYIPPSRPDVVFVWQIGTAPAARKKGVGRSLLHALLNAPACRHVRFLEATVTPSNTASMRLFQSIAHELKTGFRESSGFQGSDFDIVGGTSHQHEPENLVRIGPIKSLTL